VFEEEGCDTYAGFTGVGAACLAHAIDIAHLPG
jgi:hypothetical protein